MTDLLITGAPGWLGTRLVETAWCTGARIRCLVHPAVDHRILTDISPRIWQIRGDLNDAATVRAFCRDAKDATLFHLAGVIHPQRVSEWHRTHVTGTSQLLLAAIAGGVRRVVVVSSNAPCGVNANCDERFNEQSPHAPQGGYGVSKARMEDVVRQVASSVETVILRPCWYYGPHQPARQTRFFEMIRDGRFPILGDGRQKRSLSYIDHVVQALWLAARVPQAAGQTYWIADREPYTITEIVEAVQAAFARTGIPTRTPLHLPRVVGTLAQMADACLQSVGAYNQSLHVLGEMGETIACDVTKAERELGYTPTTSLHDGMEASVRWCVERGML